MRARGLDRLNYVPILNPAPLPPGTTPKVVGREGLLFGDMGVSGCTGTAGAPPRTVSHTDADLPAAG